MTTHGQVRADSPGGVASGVISGDGSTYDGPSQLGFGTGVYELSTSSGGSWATVNSGVHDLMAVFQR